jgi:hypothetical protein
MKITFLLIASGLMLSLRAQDTLKFSGSGKEFEVYVQTNDPDKVPRLNFWIGNCAGLERNSFGGASYYIPKKHFFNFHVGQGVGAEGILVFKNWTTTKNLSLSIGSNSREKSDYYDPTTIYVATVPIQKRVSLGLHYGGGMYKQQSFGYNLTSNNVAVGISLIRTYGLHWKMNTNYGEKRGSKFVTLNVDGVYYFNHSYPVPNDITIIAPGTTPTSSDEMTQQEFDDETSAGNINLGARIYLEGNSQKWSKSGLISFKYMAGLGIPSHKEGIFFIAGLGLSFAIYNL